MAKYTTPTKVESSVAFIGIDFHKKASVIAFGDKNGTLIKRDRIINDEKTIRERLSPHRGAKCTVESCRGMEWFIDLLEDIGLEVTMCDPRRVKLIAETRNKTDKRDARVLMELLAKDYLPACYIPTSEERSMRERLRWRMQLMKTTTRIKLRIHALLDKENKGLRDPFTKSGRDYLKTVELQPHRRILLDKHLHVLEFMEEQHDEEFKWIKKTCANDKNAKLLLSIPGVGVISAAVLVAELGDISRFRNAEKVGSYLGLVPSESSSGERRNLGGITKQGSKLVRWLLVQDAWIAIKQNAELEHRFSRICAKKGKQIAIVAIARMLGEIAYCVLRHQKPFSNERLKSANAK